MGDMDLIPLQTKPHSLADSSDVEDDSWDLDPSRSTPSGVSCCPVNTGRGWGVPHVSGWMGGCWIALWEAGQGSVFLSEERRQWGLFPLHRSENGAKVHPTFDPR